MIPEPRKLQVDRIYKKNSEFLYTTKSNIQFTNKVTLYYFVFLYLLWCTQLLIDIKIYSLYHKINYIYITICNKNK